MITLYNCDTFLLLRNWNTSCDLLLTDVPYDLCQTDKEYLHNQFLRIARTVIVFSPPENQWITPADQYGFWIKPISTKNTSKKYSRFVEMLFFYNISTWNNDRHWSQYTNVFTDLVDNSSLHPFRKPPSLIERLIRNHTNENDLVVDLFMGSGVVGEVCNNLNRRFIGNDIDENCYKHCLEIL
jgi:hypothetical protein